MADNRTEGSDLYGQLTSPGGFVFGVQGWVWGEPRPRAITFFLDNTAKVSDQYGRPIRGALIDNKEVKFAPEPPKLDGTDANSRGIYATHLQVIAALEVERVDWKTITWAGWPQLPYEELKKLPTLPPTPVEELRKIKDPKIRKDSLRMRREIDEAKVAELQPAEE